MRLNEIKKQVLDLIKDYIGAWIEEGVSRQWVTNYPNDEYGSIHEREMTRTEIVAVYKNIGDWMNSEVIGCVDEWLAVDGAIKEYECFTYQDEICQEIDELIIDPESRMYFYRNFMKDIRSISMTDILK